MALIIRTFPRATPPHMETLSQAVTPLLAVNGAGGFFPTWTGSAVHIEYGDWTGVDEGAVQAAVDAVPTDSISVRNKYAADHIEQPGSGIGDEVAKQALLTLLDLLNVERAQHGRAAITPALFIAEVKSRL